MRSRRTAFAVLAVALLVCNASDASERVIAARRFAVRLRDIKLRLEPVAPVPRATTLAVRHGDPTLYVAEKVGRVWAVGGDAPPRLVLDMAHEVTDLTDAGPFNEQGLLGLAFSPDGGYLYAQYSDRLGESRLRSYRFTRAGADVASARDILRSEQPGEIHYGGNLVFGPDGYLYVGRGDGGSRHGVTSQRVDTLLGKILRIDPRPEERIPYRVPPDNPFVGKAGVRPEIFSYGLRNPWRFSFDRVRGDLWIADVGENRYEEIDFRPASNIGGENFGWNIYEGDEPFASVIPAHISTKLDRHGRYVKPLFVYAHPLPGCAAVLGGFVYRGERIPELVGSYVFGDLCSGQLHALRARNGVVVAHHVFDVGVPGLSSLGEDASGELYALTLSRGVFRIGPQS
jgi:glucose/arabinose dehydrogenase